MTDRLNRILEAPRERSTCSVQTLDQHHREQVAATGNKATKTKPVESAN